jgi:hypothetical protein
MALTITQTPQAYTPSDNQVLYAWVWNNIANQSKLTFLVEIFVNNISVANVEVFNDFNASTNSYGHIDISDYVKSYVNKSKINQSSFVALSGNTANVHITVKAKYYVLTTLTFSAITTGATKVIFKSCLSAYDFNAYDSVKYSAISQASKGLFMTDNTNINFNAASEVYLNFINPTGTTKVIDVQMFNSAGALIDTRSSGFIPVGMLTMKISATSLIALGFSVQNVAVNMRSLKVVVRNDSTDDICTELKTLTLQLTECDETQTSVQWLNRFGAYDCFIFTHNNIHSATIQDKTFQSYLGAWNADTNTYNYSTQNTGVQSYQKNIIKKIQIVSGWLKAYEQNYLVQIYESPLVYMMEGLYIYKNIIINNSTYQLKQDLYNDELFNEILDVTLPHQSKSMTL